MKTIAIFPGRFQPFGKHHNEAYQWLSEQYGEKNTFIATSNSVDENSPFNFHEKKSIIAKFGISESNIIECQSPYRPIEILEKFDLENTNVVFMLGGKDIGRLPFIKKDGSKGYFQPYPSNPLKMESANKHGYVVNTPHVSILIPEHGEMSGTTLRQALKNASITEFTNLMGWFDKSLYEMIINRLGSNIGEVINESKSIMHLYDDDTLTFEQIQHLCKCALFGRLEQKSRVFEKVDGQNLLATVDSTGPKIAIGDARILDEGLIKTRYANRPELCSAFLEAKHDITSLFNSMSGLDQKKYFENGKRWVNMEVVHPDTRNVIYYGQEPFLQFHSFITFEGHTRKMDFNEIDSFVNSLHPEKIKTDMTFSYRGPNEIQFELTDNDKILSNKIGIKISNNFSKMLNSVALTSKSTIREYYRAYWKERIEKKFATLPLPARNHLLDRWGNRDKSYKLNSMTIPKFRLGEVKDFDKNVYERENNMLRNKIKFNVLLASTYAMKNITNSINQHQKECRLMVEKELLEFYGNQSVLLEHQEEIVEQDELYTMCGGFTNFVAMEGITFFHNDKLFKMTGLFSPINQMLGIIKYKTKG